jgi:V8-like Glu-specific endopeptidase
MSKSQIGAEVNGLLPLTGSNYGKSLGLCPSEKFVEQNTGSFCSGFLIAPDLIVTAGHCVPDLKSCGEATYVFGYHVGSPGVLPTSIPATEAYTCAALLHTQSPSDGADFAVVKLDRPVTNHAPLNLRISGDIAVGADLTVMGYPEGLPLKIAGDAKVRSVTSPGFFVANTDSYAGNSGSAVINSLTHEVEGVLVRGEKDFLWTPQGCATSYRCKEDACRGEDITRIGEVVKMLNSPALR